MEKISIPVGTKVTTAIENNMLVFEFECENIPWQPKQGEMVYMSKLNSLIGVNRLFFNYNDLTHPYLFELGLVFQTEEQAIEKTNEIIKFLRK
jgi:hypothetical protein